jgi:hypothetical protein
MNVYNENSFSDGESNFFYIIYGLLETLHTIVITFKENTQLLASLQLVVAPLLHCLLKLSSLGIHYFYCLLYYCYFKLLYNFSNFLVIF